ncbi:hypothetical protein C0992_012089, partial [Termitomyces sp. T32_za158]
MDMLNAPQQANESQQDFERRQNAAQRQANTSGMPHWALSEVETATSYHAGDDEAEEPPEMRTPHRRVTIKEEEREESIHDEPVTLWRIAQRVHLMENWNEDKHDWTFKEVLIGLYNHFVNTATMQEARKAFQTAAYDAQTGVQTFYDDLVGHAQNMAVYPDEFTIWETFLDGIPAEMHCALIRDDNLSPEVNTVTEILAYAIRYEQAQGQRQPVKVGTFLAKGSEMERNRNPRFVVCQMLPASHKPVPGPPVNAPAARDARYGPGVGQPGPKATRDAPPKVAPPKAAFGGGDVGYRPISGAARCYNCGRTGHYSKDCKAPRAQVWAAHMAAVESNADSDADAEPEELVDDEEAPQEDGEPIAGEDVKSVQINGDEYIAVDVYDNDYYARDDEEEHMFALTEHQGDGHVCMQCVTLQKAADKLQRPHYTPQEKECLVTYVEVNGHPAWTLWDSGSTTTGITPQFVHVNAIRVHELTEPLMLQLRTVGSRTVGQFGAEVK